VVSRCTPETEVCMVEALHRRGQKMVMTGDGINDSQSNPKRTFSVPKYHQVLGLPPQR
jgi:high-affinity K+ transport system ATPase subunit B